jgi:hypothetical protein
MMTAVPNRREPHHGVTVERGLRGAEQSWLKSSSFVNATAIGFYNELGGYTIGQVFPSYDLSKTELAKYSLVMI